MHYLRKLKSKQVQKPSFVNKTDCELDMNDFNGNSQKSALTPKIRKTRSVREGAHGFAIASKGRFQSSTKPSVKSEREGIFMVRSKANEDYSSNDFIVNLPNPEISRQNTMRTEGSVTSESSDESHTTKLKKNGSTKLLTHMKSVDKIDVSQSKARELCDMLEQNNGRNTDLNKLEIIPNQKKVTASYFSIQGMTRKLSRKDSHFDNKTEFKTVRKDSSDIDDREQKSERRPPVLDTTETCKDKSHSLITGESAEMRNTDSPKSVSKYSGIHDPVDHSLDKDLIVPGCAQDSEMYSSKKESSCHIDDNLDQSTCKNALDCKFHGHLLC